MGENSLRYRLAQYYQQEPRAEKSAQVAAECARSPGKCLPQTTGVVCSRKQTAHGPASTSVSVSISKRWRRVTSSSFFSKISIYWQFLVYVCKRGIACLEPTACFCSSLRISSYSSRPATRRKGSNPMPPDAPQAVDHKNPFANTVPTAIHTVASGFTLYWSQFDDTTYY